MKDSGCLAEEELTLFNRILRREGSEQDCAESLRQLSAWLHRAHGKPPYILLDEYDTPLHSAHVDRYYDQMITFIRSFMVQTFSRTTPT